MTKRDGQRQKQKQTQREQAQRPQAGHLEHPGSAFVHVVTDSHGQSRLPVSVQRCAAAGLAVFELPTCLQNINT